jgi:hypothetical protein
MPEAAQQIAQLEKKVGAGNKSPLFARLANFYLQDNRPKDALRLCDEGLAVFPHYTTGHLVKGKALLALKMNAEARREFEIVHQFLPANKTVEFILSNIEIGEGETLTSPPAETAATKSRLETTRTQPSLEPEPTVQDQQHEVSPPGTPDSGFDTQTTTTETPAASETVPANFFEAVAENPKTSEDPFGFGAPAVETGEPSAKSVSQADESPFGDFPNLPETEHAVAGAQSSAEPSSSSGSMFDFPGSSQESALSGPGEESFAAFSSRMRGELTGENTMTLGEYLNAPRTEASSASILETAAEPPSIPAPAADPIEDLAAKLQTAKKITPVINLTTRTTTPASEADTPASTGFVTPTLAEIYAKQGWYDDAIKAYHTLCITKPTERERFEKRIAELEEQKKQQPPT